jgi:hypothetical protein
MADADDPREYDPPIQLCRDCGTPTANDLLMCGQCIEAAVHKAEVALGQGENEETEA